MPKPPTQSALVSVISPEQNLLRSADRKVESLEMQLSECAVIINGTRTDLYNCQKARHEETAALNSRLLLEKKRHHECRQAYESVCLENQRMKQDIHALTIADLQLQQELAYLYNHNQFMENHKIGQTSPQNQEHEDVVRETILQTRNAELEEQIATSPIAEVKTEQLQQMTPSSEPYNTDLTKLWTEEGRLMLQEPAPKKRFNSIDDRMGSEGGKRQVKRARKPRQLKLKEQGCQITDCK